VRTPEAGRLAVVALGAGGKVGSGLSLAVAGVFWLGGLFFLTFPVWRALGVSSPSLFLSLLLIPVGAAKLLAAP
jgi:hypothetical protein